MAPTEKESARTAVGPDALMTRSPTLTEFSQGFLRQLQQLRIRTRRAFLGSRQGSHLSLRRGHGLEFADFRPYSSGDDFRYIDWGVYARTDRLYVRQFREERDLNVVVMIDCSRSMAFPDGERKFELARELGLALGFVALADGDTVTFCPLGHTSTARFSGPRALGEARRALGNIKPNASFELLKVVRSELATQRIPGKCFFISDFLVPFADQLKTLQYLRARNFDLALIQILAPSELRLDPTAYELAVDAETGQAVELALDASSAAEYARLLAAHIEETERYCRQAGIAYLLLSSNESLGDVVFRKLPEAGMLV